MDNDNTVDVVKIEVEGEDKSATGTLDKVLAKLERIKNAGLSGGTKDIGSRVVSSGSVSKLDKFRQKLTEIRSNVNKWFSGQPLSSSQLSKLNSQADQSMTKIQELKSKIQEMQNSFSDKPTANMQTLIDKENELEAAAKRVKAQITNTTPQALVEKYTQQYDNLRSQIEQISNRQLELENNGRAFLTVAQQQPEAFEQLNEQLNREEKRFAEINDKIKSGTSNAKAFGKEVRNAFSDSVVGRFASKVKQTVNSIGRIAIYRIMRTMISQVTGAFKTGIDDMYQYSKAFNGNYARSMDQLASANLSYKNSIGAIMAPVINLVVPWLDKVVDKLIDINNTVAMVIAGLTGKSTYSKAVRVTTEYAEAANKASDNTEKVKDRVEELKRSLAGLDEITIIGNNISPISSSADGSDGVTDGVNYGSMFVEAPVDMAKVNEVKETLEKILEVAKWIGLAIAAWELIKFISSINQAISSLGTLSSKLLGISLMIVGFGIEFAGGFDIGKNGLNLKNAIITAIGSALGVAGSVLTFGSSPVGWAIGLAVAFTVLMTSITFGKMESGKELYQLTEFHQLMTQIGEDVELVSSQAQNALSALADKKSILDTTLSDFSAAQTLVDQIFDIYESSDLSTGKVAELETKIEILNGLGLDGLQLEFDNTSGTLYQIKTNAEGATEKIEATRDSVKKLTESLKEQAVEAALTDLLTEAYKRQYAAQLSVERVNNDVTTAQLGVASAAKEYIDYLNSSYWKEGIIGGAQKIGYYQNALEDAQDQLEKAKTAQQDNDSVLQTSQGYIDSITDALVGMKTGAKDYSDPATKSSDILNSSVKTGTEKVGDLKAALKNFSYDSAVKSYSNGAQSSTSNLSETLGSAQKQQDALKDKITGFKNNSTVSSFADRATESGKNLSDSLINASKDAQKLRDSLSQIDGFSGNYSYSYSFGETPKYASGGFPEDGFFYANHNELVGQFSNGRTAVANNEQIVEGISNGVSQANEETNSLLRENNRLMRQLLSKDSTIDVSTIASAFNRQNRRDGKVTVPVSV